MSSSIVPSSLGLTDAKDGVRGLLQAINAPMKRLPAMFDASNLTEVQGAAISADGTAIPYLIIMRKEMKFDGSNPTLLYGYGGFRISLLPSYSALIGDIHTYIHICM
jgi:prolyl oligopeptidase